MMKMVFGKKPQENLETDILYFKGTIVTANAFWKYSKCPISYM